MARNDTFYTLTEKELVKQETRLDNTKNPIFGPNSELKKDSKLKSFGLFLADNWFIVIVSGLIIGVFIYSIFIL